MLFRSGWNVIEVSAKSDGDVDRESLERAMSAAISEVEKPTLIRLKSVIAWPAPKARNTAKSHGSALGSDEVAATKVELGLPNEDFYFPKDVEEHVRKVAIRNKDLRRKWEETFKSWKLKFPEQEKLLARLKLKELPDSWDRQLPSYSEIGRAHV